MSSVANSEDLVNIFPVHLSAWGTKLCPFPWNYSQRTGSAFATAWRLEVRWSQARW